MDARIITLSPIHPFSLSQIAVWLLCASLTLSLAACGDGAAGDEGTAGEGAPLRFIFVTHGQASDPFWSAVQRGADRAAQDLGVNVEYQAPERYSMATMARLIDAAVASNPDGLVVSIPDADALDEAIRNAIEAGIPVVSINSGEQAAKELGVMVHVGQSEYEAGYEAGKRMAEAGVQHAVCVNQEVGNTALDRRCQGLSDALAEAGAMSEMLAVQLGNPTEAQQRIQGALLSQPSIDGLLTLGPTGAVPALRALREAGKLDTVALATFDLSPEIVEAVKGGDILFAINQQPYLQGYLPVVLLTLRAHSGSEVASDMIRTGPSFVTSENIARLEELPQ